jgi:hypothetical protein
MTRPKNSPRDARASQSLLDICSSAIAIDAD